MGIQIRAQRKWTRPDVAETYTGRTEIHADIHQIPKIPKFEITVWNLKMNKIGFIFWFRIKTQMFRPDSKPGIENLNSFLWEKNNIFNDSNRKVCC